MILFTWEMFDQAIKTFPKPNSDCDGFYPIPRGGMVLAVALSHKFGFPIIKDYELSNKSIIVDDIADSGNTLKKIRKNQPAYVLVKRYTCDLTHIFYSQYVIDTQWVVFPWEDKSKVKEDYANYISRK